MGASMASCLPHNLLGSWCIVTASDMSDNPGRRERMSLMRLPLDSSTFDALIAGETMYWQSRLQARKQMQIARCQSLTACQRSQHLPTEVLHQVPSTQCRVLSGRVMEESDTIVRKTGKVFESPKKAYISWDFGSDEFLKWATATATAAAMLLVHICPESLSIYPPSQFLITSKNLEPWKSISVVT